MIKYLNNNSYRDFEKKLKKIRSHKELKKFYKNFLKNFQYLNLTMILLEKGMKVFIKLI